MTLHTEYLHAAMVAAVVGRGREERPGGNPPQTTPPGGQGGGRCGMDHADGSYRSIATPLVAKGGDSG